MLTAASPQRAALEEELLALPHGTIPQFRIYFAGRLKSMPIRSI